MGNRQRKNERKKGKLIRKEKTKVKKLAKNHN